MLGQRRTRWPTIKSAFDQRFVPAGLHYESKKGPKGFCKVKNILLFVFSFFCFLFVEHILKIWIGVCFGGVWQSEFFSDFFQLDKTPNDLFTECYYLHYESNEWP